MKKLPAILLLLLLSLAPLAAQTAGIGESVGSTTTSGTTTGTSTTTTTGSTTATASGTGASTTSSTTPDLTVPVDKKDTWVVGFSVFDEEGVSPENQYLASSVALLLKNDLSGITTHDVSSEERDLVRTSIIDREQQTVAQSITSLRQQRDALILDSSLPSASALSGFDTKIKAAEARRDFLTKLDLAKVTVAAQKPLVIKDGTGAGNLFDPPRVPPSAFCVKNSLDILVGGTIREVEGYILVDAWVYDALRDEKVFTYRDASLREETYASIPGISRKIVGLFLGKPWASISFSTEPPDGSLYVDGKLAATGKTPTVYVPPGSREIRVSAPGYKDVTRTMTLDPESDTAVNVTLEKQKEGTILISSTPPDADVYLESVWQGRTPLTLEKPFERSRVVLSHTGFYDQLFSISASSPAELSFTLTPNTISRDAIQKKARDDFYTSFTWFALTLPIPFFTYAFAIDQALAVQQLQQAGNNSGALRAQALGNTLYAGYLVGTAISVSLFTWMVFRIIHYVSVSTRTAG